MATATTSRAQIFADGAGIADGHIRLGPGIPEVTVVVPTRNERENVAPLLGRLAKVSRDLEVVFVDDSTDETPRVISQQGRIPSAPVRLIHRPPSRRGDGLGGAVLAGIAEARSEWVCVMDGDLQHPPELIDPLVEEGDRSGADVVVASRHCAGGDVGGLSLLRGALSGGAALLARGLFPRKLRGVTDPMSGFFLVRRATIDLEALRPRGFKILLEILLSARRLVTSEVAFRFAERHAGEVHQARHQALRHLDEGH